MYTSIFIVSSIVQILVAFHIFRRGRQNLSYLLFFLISAATWCWVFLNYLSLVYLASGSLIYIVRLIMFFAVLQTALFYLFANKFPNGTWGKPDWKFLNYGILTCLTALVAISPYMFESVKVVNGVIQMQTGAAIVIFVAFLGFTVIRSFQILIDKFRDSVGMLRTQLLILLCAAILNWIIIPITNFALTLTLKNLVFVAASPIYGLLFSSAIAYAIARHYLFDVKTILRDSIIYINYYLRSGQDATLQYYQLQTLVYESSSNHVTLDFSGVKKLDQDAVILINTLRDYMEKQGKKIYLIHFNKKVFKQLRLAAVL